MLVVAMPVTPGGADLPGAAMEANLLTGGFRVGQVLGSWPGAAGEATRATVTSALPRHAFAHFACHASCDAADPAASALHLQDPSAASLTMADILALNMEGGSFAFLSACETALTTEALANEGLHLVTAFGLAGYPQVIGTLWKIADSAGSIMTELIYQGMRPAGAPGERAVPRAGLAARALHDATLALRARFPDHPVIWAAHVHAGA
jgi:CHAT domain-containing protein